MTFEVVKDPDASLDYTWDWSNWLESDTIDTATFIVPTGITEVRSENTTTTATVWLSGGTSGQSYSITCRITTADGRIDDRTLKVIVSPK